jgi:hypothetical protein
METWTEVWSIPPSAVPLSVSQVRKSTNANPTPPVNRADNYATLPIAISQVTDLSADLSAINASIFPLSSSVPSLATTVGSNSIQLHNLQDEVNTLKTQVAALSAELVSLNNVVAGLTGTSGGGVVTVCPAFAYSEKLTGDIDGKNVIFTLVNAPNPLNSLEIFRNGMRLAADVDYTVSGATVTFNAISVPRNGDLLVANYTH